MSDRHLIPWLKRLSARFTPSTFLWLGVGLYLLSAGTHVVLGQPNGDEGYYLYASARVWQGALPYRDFAYVQMPALPYLFGLPQVLFGPSIYVGRLTSVAFALAQLGAGMALAHRYGGRRAAAVAALLLGSFTFVVYFHTIVKTYGLVSLLFTLTFLAMPRAGGSPWRWALALTFATLAALVRLSAAAFWLPVALYGLWTVRGGLPTRVTLAGWAAALWLPALYLFSRNPAATQWSLLGLHLDQWHGATPLRRLAEMVAFRLPAIATGFGPHLPLIGVTTAVYSLGRRPARRLGLPLLMLLSLGLFAVSHLITGEWHLEYMVPAVAAAMPLLAIGVARGWEQAGGRQMRVLWASLLAVTLGAALIQNFPLHLVLNPANAPVEVIRAAARVVADNSAPDDRLLAIEALTVAVEAHRDVLPGLALSYTSVQQVTTAEALALHIVSPDMVAAALEQHVAKLVLLTPGDRRQLAALGVDARIQAALDAQYRPLATLGEFGQYFETITIYVCRACP